MNDFEQRFAFVDNEILRKNLTQTFELVANLVAVLEKEKNLSKEFLRKTILIQTASIIEALIFYFLKEKNLWNEFSQKWEYKNPINKIQKLSEKEEIIWCTRKKEKLSKYTKFQHLIEACEKYKLFNKKEIVALSNIREYRNQLHIQSLTSIDNGISQKELEEVFEITRIVIKKIEKNL